MAIVIIKKNENLDKLTGRLLKAKASKRSREDAAQALRAANPGIDLGDLRPGTPVVIPMLTDARSGKVDGAAEPLSGSGADVSTALRTGLDQLLQALDDAEQARRIDAEAAHEAMSSDSVRRPAEKDKALARTLKLLAKSLAEDDERASRLEAAVRDSLAMWSSDLEALEGRLR